MLLLDMALFFALSLPGLVVLLIIAGIFQLVFFRHRRKDRPGAASIGFNLLDTALRPGREHLHAEQESKRVFRKEDEEGAPPRSKVDLTKNVAKIVRASGTDPNRGDDQADKDSKRENE